MRRFVILLVVLGGSAASLASDRPYSFGSLGPHLAAEDVASITELAMANGGVPWALYGWYSQVLPEVRYVDAFLPAVLSTARLRRGRVLHLKCMPVFRKQDGCGQWVLDDVRGEYAQVADGPTPLAEEAAVRRQLERPIRVTGSFSDRELLTLVEYVRSSPVSDTPDGMYGLSVSGQVPILDIERQRDSSVWVRLSVTGNPGQTATVVRKGDRWQVVSLVFWVA